MRFEDEEDCGLLAISRASSSLELEDARMIWLLFTLSTSFFLLLFVVNRRAVESETRPADGETLAVVKEKRSPSFCLEGKREAGRLTLPLTDSFDLLLLWTVVERSPLWDRV